MDTATTPAAQLEQHDGHPLLPSDIARIADTARAANLRRRVREAMKTPPVDWACPKRVAQEHGLEPLPVRKARAIALKLAHMPVDLWEGQLFAGSMTLEAPRVHAERGFPEYLTADERTMGKAKGWGIGCFGHIVPDYPTLLGKGLRGIRADAEAQLEGCRSDAETAFLRSVAVALDGVMAYAERLAAHCAEAAGRHADEGRAAELRTLAEVHRAARSHGVEARLA